MRFAFVIGLANHGVMNKTHGRHKNLYVTFDKRPCRQKRKLGCTRVANIYASHAFNRLYQSQFNVWFL